MSDNSSQPSSSTTVVKRKRLREDLQYSLRPPLCQCSGKFRCAHEHTRTMLDYTSVTLTRIFSFGSLAFDL